MDKEFYKALKTKEEKLEYMDIIRKCRKKEWDMENGDKLYQYRRKCTLNRCFDRCSVPTKKTIEKYSFTQDELLPIFENLFFSVGLKMDCDTKDSSSADSE